MDTLVHIIGESTKKAGKKMKFDVNFEKPSHVHEHIHVKLPRKLHILVVFWLLRFLKRKNFTVGASNPNKLLWAIVCHEKFMCGINADRTEKFQKNTL